jgi:hypothetical protein
MYTRLEYLDTDVACPLGVTLAMYLSPKVITYDSNESPDCDCARQNDHGSDGRIFRHCEFCEISLWES